jgi:hypothetical protein
MPKVRLDDIESGVLLNSSHNTSEFNSIIEDLNDFIQHHALKEQERMLSKTYLFIYDEIIIGFITLSVDSVRVPYLRKEDFEIGTYYNLPCILIGRLAVDSAYEGQDVGTYILNWAVGLVTTEICGRVGCRYITVDPIVTPEYSAVDFYIKSDLGFTHMEEIRVYKTETRLYINLYKSRTVE